MLFFVKKVQKYLVMSKICSTFAPAFEKRRQKHDESVAQQVEHIPFKDGVLGSSPSWFTKGDEATRLPLFYPITMLTMRPGTTIIFLIVAPLRYFAVSSCARTSFSTSSFGVSLGAIRSGVPFNWA